MLEDKNDIAALFMATGEVFAVVKFSEKSHVRVCAVRKQKGLHNGRAAG